MQGFDSSSPASVLHCHNKQSSGSWMSVVHCTLMTVELMASGYIAQWLERLTADQQVPGSNPGVPFDVAAGARRAGNEK